MNYRYTWNHILLFAQICHQIDDEESVTASWVQITEQHNRQAFPFTLWPLSYRTCEVTTSPAMCSPVYITGTDYNVKMFKCNEVVIICIQKHSCDIPCLLPCRADLDGSMEDEEMDEVTQGLADNHELRHSHSKTEALLPCHVAHCYHQIKTSIKDAYYAIQDGTECVICIGHGAAATMASCLASDMSLEYEAEKEFLGLETRRISVDFVGFSDNVVASPAYWEECSLCIDEYITIVFEGCESSSKSSSNMIRNPRCSRVVINQSDSLSKPPSLFRSVSVFHKIINKGSRDNSKKRDGAAQPMKDLDRGLPEYVSALNNKIMLSL